MEWLVTNGLGGYASGTIPGVCTRRYHGLLVAALPSVGRRLMLNHLAEALRLPGGRLIRLTGQEQPGSAPQLPDAHCDFRLDMGLPVWEYEVGDFLLKKRILLPYGQNTVHVTYRLLRGTGAQLVLSPRVQFRPHGADVSDRVDHRYHVQANGQRYEIRSAREPELPPLRLYVHGREPELILDGGAVSEFEYRKEAARGYPHVGELWSPGRFNVDLEFAHECTLIASAETWDAMLALPPTQARAAELNRRQSLLEQAHPKARTGIAAELVLAADQFLILPVSRPHDVERARAEGDQACTVIAGYHWFTDWGRDTMISLDGLTLLTGRHLQAGCILRTFLHYVRDGLIPNSFPEGDKEGQYHTADATLWFFHALDRYVAQTGDRLTLRRALPIFRSILEHHVRGTRFGIGVDPSDGLMRQGEEGYQLTWMDAKVGNWVVTPRRGKAVEINALFYNALRLMEKWLAEEGDHVAATDLNRQADRLRDSFNRRFWNPQTGCLFDVVDGEHGNDPAVRPNMLLAISLPHPVLEPSRWRSVIDVAMQTLFTPAGLRSLAPNHPDYKPHYDGDLRSRDAAYHQGTVWSWLAGPFCDAWYKVYPEDTSVVQELVQGYEEQLGAAGMGSISEISDAEEPHTPRGCIAQAWSVAEALRVVVNFAPPASGIGNV